MKNKNRIYLLDELRGLCIILMVAYHFFYSAGMMYHYDWAVNIFKLLKPWQPILPISFILLSGIACNLSRSNIKRGLLLLGVAVAITLVTYFFMPEQVIWFGIIHFIAFANIICAPLKKPILKIPSVIGVIIFGLLFVATYNIQQGYMGFMPDYAIQLPKFLYSTDYTMMLGFYSPNFYSADYFPLIPWIFLFIAGICLGKKIHKLPKILKKRHIRPLAFVGRHSLIIYLAHQPIILGIIYAVQHFIK